jgi:hypothetical protein
LTRWLASLKVDGSTEGSSPGTTAFSEERGINTIRSELAPIVQMRAPTINSGVSRVGSRRWGTSTKNHVTTVTKARNVSTGEEAINRTPPHSLHND